MDTQTRQRLHLRTPILWGFFESVIFKQSVGYFHARVISMTLQKDVMYLLSINK